ncbi:S-layer homology domain-containing protein [Patescibacteria group bacterium]|nr:S-layer homology domain-containing protein [Patescibacteria group bacterium]
MKRLAHALIVSLVLVPLSAGLASADFPDVSATSRHYAAITDLVSQEILVGYEDGTFRPDQDVTRAEAIKIILLGMGISVDEGSSGASIFSDVSEGDWFYRIVGTAVDRGIIKGYEDGTFRPSQTVNRAEAVKITLEAAGVTASSMDGEWYLPYETYAKEKNIEPPQTDGLWHPEGAISRATISEMVYRQQVVKETGGEFDEATNWLRNNFVNIEGSLKVPFGWSYDSQGIGAVWLLDSGHGQKSPLTPYENGGILLVSSYPNTEGKSATTLLNEVKSGLNGMISDVSIGGYPGLRVSNYSGDFYKEWYVVIPNNDLLHFAAMRGEGAYFPYLESYLEKIVMSLKYVPASEMQVSVEEALEAILSAIQVDGKGQEMMNFLTDLELIETDAIGVGTGPVDYFYSPSANITIKYERSFDVILDVEDGNTSNF